MARILVVEDDEKLNQIMCAYLARSGYQATGCHNPAEAYDLLYAGDYDLILSDIMMPGENGFDFAREIRRQNPQIPILFVTALDDFPSKQKGFSAGVDDYMVKPVDMDENRDGFELRLGAGIARVRRFQRALYHQCGP